MQFLRRLLGSFFGIGYIPGPSGTYSSLVTTALMFLAYYLGCPWWGIAAAAVVCIFVGVAAGTRPMEDFGQKDPHAFVLDETAGMLIAGLAAWWTESGRAAAIVLAVAFLWFRVTDITKPPPARQLERLPRGWGIVFDDVAAGLMALGLTILCLLAWHPFWDWFKDLWTEHYPG
jgi:phosphatidylglycerophosphatase A